MQLTSASGYEALRATNLGKGVIYAGTIKARNWEEDFIPYVANTRVLDDLTKCGDIITFEKPPQTGPWRPYEKNQEFVYDQVSSESFCVSICNAAQKHLKFDREDIRKACDSWDEFETAMIANVWQYLSEHWQRNLLTGMSLQVASTNVGSKAGRYRNINMGTVGNPLHLEPANLVNFLAKTRELLRSAGRWYDGEMFMLVPPEFGTLVLQTAYEKQWCCDPSEGVLFKGLKSSSLHGFRIIETDYVVPSVDQATGRLVFPLIAGWNDAYAFTGDIVEADLRDIPNSWGVSYNMLSVFGGGVIYPEALAKAYVTFSTDGVVAP